MDDASQIAYLVIYAQIDDGAVVYLNGEEVLRFNIPGTGLVLSSGTAAAAIGNADEQTFFEYSVPAAALNTGTTSGTNTLAVEVHQAYGQISDLGFDLELIGRDCPVLL